ncbi:hypothetical protein GDO78_017150, partial [Eleutherodactylus coqui]
MEDLGGLAYTIFTAWLAVIVVCIMLPSMFGVSLGISEVYMKILVKMLEWATLRIQKRFEEHKKIRIVASNDILIEGCTALMSEDIRQALESNTLFFLYPLFTDACVLCCLLPAVINPTPASLCSRVTLATIGISWLVIGATLVGQLPNGRVKNWLSEKVHLVCCRICARALSSAIQYHNKENRPRKGGICVANHTSPIDIIILTNDGCYAMVSTVLRRLEMAGSFARSRSAAA